MADSFDPYHKWLGIAPKDRPPNHYRLLAIELFESDLDVIEGAADRQMAHVRTFQGGQNSALSQRILNELSAARLCLLDPQKKAAYDRQLQEKLAAAVENAASAKAHVSRQGDHGPLANASGYSDVQPAPTAKVVAMPVARPLGRMTPPEAVPTIPIVIANEDAESASIHRRVSPQAPVWRQPAVLGAAGALVAFAVIGYALTRGGKPPAEVAANATAPPTPDSRRQPTAPPLDPLKQPPVARQTAKPAAESTVNEPTADGMPAETAAGSKADLEIADLEIIDAAWGAGEKWVNVTDAVRGLMQDNRLMMMAWGSVLGSPDPAPGAGKKLRLHYRCRGKQYSTEYYEFWFVYLDGNAPAPPTDSPGTLELLEARYGAAKTYVDVLPLLRARLANGRLTVAADELAEATSAELEKNGVGAGIFRRLGHRRDAGNVGRKLHDQRPARSGLTSSDKLFQQRAISAKHHATVAGVGA